MAFATRLLSGSFATSLNDGARAAAPAADLRLAELMGELKRAAITQAGQIVDYAALDRALAPIRAELYAGLTAFDPAALPDRAHRLAFWINLYNVLILDAVLAFRVRKSVVGVTRGFMRFFEKAAYQVGGLRCSANDIEHGVLRANRGHPYGRRAQFAAADPRCAWVVAPLETRIHFALNCASRSCPPMRVYAAADLAAQLDLATRAFVTADAEVDGQASTLSVSALFKWYRGDFQAAGGVIPFIVRHLPETDARRGLLARTETAWRLRYRKYDWGLNARA